MRGDEAKSRQLLHICFTSNIYEYYVELPTYETSQIDMTVCRSVGLAIPNSHTQRARKHQTVI